RNEDDDGTAAAALARLDDVQLRAVGSAQRDVPQYRFGRAGFHGCQERHDENESGNQRGNLPANTDVSQARARRHTSGASALGPDCPAASVRAARMPAVPRPASHLWMRRATRGWGYGRP